jgi:putative transposase
MKYQFMKNHEYEFKIERMSQVFEVSSSGYYAYRMRKSSERKQENDRLLVRIREVYQSSRQTYGSPRIFSELRANGENCSRKRVAKLMRESNIVAKMKKKFKITTKADPRALPAPNLLNQEFTAQEPNQRWVADFSYVATQAGWLYVAAVMDLFSRIIVGLYMSERMTNDLVIQALQQALKHRRPKAGLIHHSDKGCQYTSEAFQALLKSNNIICSMSGTGNCYDNAAMESFFHSLKTEHIYFERYETREQAKQSIFEYIEVFYNRKRRHSSLGYLSPVVFEQQRQQQIGGLYS